MLEIYMRHPNKKTEHIFINTATILVQDGGLELSMRKIATQAEMSLSNVQYYFKTKDVLLTALLTTFVENYIEDLNQELIQAVTQETSSKIIFKNALAYIFGRSTNAICMKMFKELWLLSEHNSHIQAAMTQYYSTYYQMIINWIQSITLETYSKASIKDVANLLMPYIEGFYITHVAIPLSPEELADLLTRLAFELLETE